jgi:hypothetical protein
MEEEMSCIKELGMWVLVPKPEGTNTVGCKWVYKLKHNAKGEIARFKVRLIAQGFTQVPGADYVDTFAPVVKFLTLCVLLTLATHYNWEIHQMDMKNAYLNGMLAKTIYMCFIDLQSLKHICQLAHSL